MKNNTSRKLLFTSLTLALFTALSAISMDALTNNNDFQDILKNYGVGIKELVGGVIVIGIVLLVLTYLQFKYSQPAEPITENIEPDVKRFFDLLKERYQNRYQSKLGGRFEITLEVSENLDSPNPHSITEQFDDNTSDGKAIEVIRKAFEKKGRLLIVGNPGVGKTVLLLNLAIDLLDKIKDLEKEPFPVIFNLTSWSDKYANFGEWLKAMLVSDYGLSEVFASTLLQQGRIIFLLDGLDELGRNEWWERNNLLASEKRRLSNMGILQIGDPILVRALCLASLNNYLRDGRKAVMCCRVEEFKQIKETNQDAPVSAIVRVLNLTKEQVLEALHRATGDKDIKHHASANNLLKMVEAEGNDNFLEVLGTPFYFTTAMEIFDQEILNEKDLPKTIKDIEAHLVEKYVKRKLADSNSFGSNQSTKWLEWLARLMERRQFITFELTDLQLNDLSEKERYSFWSGLSLGLVFCLIGGLVGGMSHGLVFGLIGLLFSSSHERLDIEITAKLKFSHLLFWWFWKIILKAFLIRMLWFSALFFFVAIIVLRVSEKYLLIGFNIILCFNLFSALLNVLLSLNDIGGITYLQKPYQKIYGDFFVRLVFALLIFLALIGFALLLTESLNINHYIDENIIRILVIIVPLMLLRETTLFNQLILRFCLYLEGSMPLRYATFLDHAASLRILEKDGGQWRFRHQNFQEYFASLDG